jgi:hypothetical protein
MTMAARRLDRRAHGRGHARVGSGVPRSLVRARRIRRRALTRHVPGAGRRRSRADGMAIGHHPRPKIPVPTP